MITSSALGSYSKIGILWVQGHIGLEGKEAVAELARKRINAIQWTRNLFTNRKEIMVVTLRKNE